MHIFTLSEDSYICCVRFSALTKKLSELLGGGLRVDNMFDLCTYSRVLYSRVQSRYIPTERLHTTPPFTEKGWEHLSMLN